MRGIIRITQKKRTLEDEISDFRIFVV